jgi:hypothetical protein
MYVGTRIGGQPTDTDSETESVHLATPQDAMGMFNTQRDKDILMAALTFAGMQGNAAAAKALTELLKAGHTVPSVGAGGIMQKGSFIQPAAPPIKTAAAKAATPAAPAATPAPLGAYKAPTTARQALKNVTHYGDTTITNAGAKAAASKFPINALEAAAIASYTGSTYTDVNEALRANKMTEDQWRYVAILNSALSKMPKYVGIVKRGVTLSKAVLDTYTPGTVKQEPGFTSTSVTSPWSGNAIFTIHSVTGVHVRKLSHHAHEDEVLIPAHSVMKVVSHTVTGSTHKIEMQQIVLSGDEE